MSLAGNQCVLPCYLIFISKSFGFGFLHFEHRARTTQRQEEGTVSSVLAPLEGAIYCVLKQCEPNANALHTSELIFSQYNFLHTFIVCVYNSLRCAMDRDCLSHELREEMIHAKSYRISSCH